MLRLTRTVNIYIFPPKMEHVFIYMWTKWLVVILPRMREGLLVLCVASVQLALDRWPVAIWFDLRCTQFGTLLAQIGHQKSRKHFSKISKLKYFKILISGAIYVFLLWATWIWQSLAQIMDHSFQNFATSLRYYISYVLNLKFFIISALLLFLKRELFLFVAVWRSQYFG